jgi:cytochrome c oxidase cbb3-type subunit 4
MDVNDMRAAWTLLSFLAFVGIALWAYSGRSKKRFEEAARLPLDDDHPPRGIAPGNNK